MHEKCIILRFEIVVFSVITVQGKWSTQTIRPAPTASIISWPVETESECPYQHIQNHVCARQYGVLTHTTLPILTTVIPQIPYQIILRTKVLMEMSLWEN